MGEREIDESTTDVLRFHYGNEEESYDDGFGSDLEIDDSLDSLPPVSDLSAQSNRGSNTSYGSNLHKYQNVRMDDTSNYTNNDNISISGDDEVESSFGSKRKNNIDLNPQMCLNQALPFPLINPVIIPRPQREGVDYSFVNEITTRTEPEGNIYPNDDDFLESPKEIYPSVSRVGSSHNNNNYHRDDTNEIPPPPPAPPSFRNPAPQQTRFPTLSFALVQPPQPQHYNTPEYYNETPPTLYPHVRHYDDGHNQNQQQRAFYPPQNSRTQPQHLQQQQLHPRRRPEAVEVKGKVSITCQRGIYLGTKNGNATLDTRNSHGCRAYFYIHSDLLKNKPRMFGFSSVCKSSGFFKKGASTVNEVKREIPTFVKLSLADGNNNNPVKLELFVPDINQNMKKSMRVLTGKKYNESNLSLSFLLILEDDFQICLVFSYIQAMPECKERKVKNGKIVHIVKNTRGLPYKPKVYIIKKNGGYQEEEEEDAVIEAEVGNVFKSNGLKNGLECLQSRLLKEFHLFGSTTSPSIFEKYLDSGVNRIVPHVRKQTTQIKEMRRIRYQMSYEQYMNMFIHPRYHQTPVVRRRRRRRGSQSRKKQEIVKGGGMRRSSLKQSDVVQRVIKEKKRKLKEIHEKNKRRVLKKARTTTIQPMSTPPPPPRFLPLIIPNINGVRRT